MKRVTAQTARKRHHCTTRSYRCRGIIEPGDRYLTHVMSPSTDTGEHWWRIAECEGCATLYGRGDWL